MVGDWDKSNMKSMNIPIVSTNAKAQIFDL